MEGYQSIRPEFKTNNDQLRHATTVRKDFTVKAIQWIMTEHKDDISKEELDGMAGFLKVIQSDKWEFYDVFDVPKNE